MVKISMISMMVNRNLRKKKSKFNSWEFRSFFLSLQAKPLTDRRRNKASDKKDVSLKRKTVLGDDEVEEVGDTMWSFLEQKHPLSDFTASGRTRQRSSSQSTQNWNNDDWSKSFDDENEV